MAYMRLVNRFFFLIQCMNNGGIRGDNDRQLLLLLLLFHNNIIEYLPDHTYMNKRSVRSVKSVDSMMYDV